MTLRLVLPYPPSVNTYWRSNRGRVHIADEGRDYRAAVVALCRRCEVSDTARLRVQIVTHAADNRRRDLDNVCKALLDALAHAGVYGDDSQIDELRVVRGERQHVASVVVEIEACP